MEPEDVEVEGLLDRVGRGDGAAGQELLGRCRDRLRRMVALRLDPRLAARVDPSDVVQEVLLDAARGLGRYARERPLPFYPWLRQFACARLVDLTRRHIGAGRRSVAREQRGTAPAGTSLACLADRLVDEGTSPSRGLDREERWARVHAALDAIAPNDREILVLRYLEGLSVAETAAVLGLTEGAVKSRHLRALVRLQGVLEGHRSELLP